MPKPVSDKPKFNIVWTDDDHETAYITAKVFTATGALIGSLTFLRSMVREATEFLRTGGVIDGEEAIFKARESRQRPKEPARTVKAAVVEKKAGDPVPPRNPVPITWGQPAKHKRT